MSESDTPIRRFVKEHPKWLGVLFWLTVLLTQAGMAAGANIGGNAGP